MRRISKKKSPRSLYGRTLLIVVLPIIFIQSISAFVFFQRHLVSITRQTALIKTEEIAAIIALAQDQRFPVAQEVAHRLGLHFEKLARQAFVPTPRESAKTRIAQKIFADTLENTFDGAWSLQAQRKHFVVQVASSQETWQFSLPIKVFTSRTSEIFVMWLIGTSFLFTLIAWLFMKNQIRPVQALAKAAEQFGRTNQFDPIRPSGARELRQAGEAFNMMQTRIKYYLDQRTEMLAGVSHDLRTPLTRMRLKLEMLPDNANVSALRQDIAEMDGMIAHFLEYVRDERLEELELVALAPIIRESAQSCFSATLVCDFQLDGQIMYPVRLQAFQRLLSNLLANCQKKAHRVRLSLLQEAQEVLLTVEDDGPGIPEQHREEVFQLFFRLDPSRTPGQGGSGVGLSIVKNLVTSMRGTVTLGTSPTLGGLCVTLRFPL
ncbi:MAG: HAMP domain-containing protein [Holosporales bacterium]|nr:HAMP domain-containing protein [Holosporales bacterium]